MRLLAGCARTSSHKVALGMGGAGSMEVSVVLDAVAANTFAVFGHAKSIQNLAQLQPSRQVLFTNIVTSTPLQQAILCSFFYCHQGRSCWCQALSSLHIYERILWCKWTSHGFRMLQRLVKN